jgi:hypothetical protein
MSDKTRSFGWAGARGGRAFGNMGTMAKPQSSSQADDAAHDVLAAEAFQMPAADPELHHGPVVLPEDPSGNGEPHDILAAEEFAMPAPRPTYHPAELAQRRGGWRRLAVELIVALLVLRALARLRRR